MAKRRTILTEFWAFMKENKAYWMAPIIIVVLVLMLIVFFGGTAVAPFIYTLF